MDHFQATCASVFVACVFAQNAQGLWCMWIAKNMEEPFESPGTAAFFDRYRSRSRGGTGWLALEPTCVPWHKRFAVINLSVSEPLSAAPPWSPKAATEAITRDYCYKPYITKDYTPRLHPDSLIATAVVR